MKPISMILLGSFLCASFFPIQANAGGRTGLHQVEFLNQRECTENRGLEVKLLTAHDNPDACIDNFILELQCPMTQLGRRSDRAPKSRSAEQEFANQVTRFEGSSAQFRTAFVGDYFVEAFVDGCDEEGHAIVNSVRVQKDGEAR